MSSGNKKQTIGYKYFLGMHMMLCHGPIDKITEILADAKKAWGGNWTSGSINVDAASLFGGDEKEGGISGSFDLQMGEPTQTLNSYLASKLPAPSLLVPAFRGVVGVIAKQIYVGTQSYLKTMAFLASRIHVRQDGIEQWYDSKAEIGDSSAGTRVSFVFANNANVKASPDGVSFPYAETTPPNSKFTTILLSPDKKKFFTITGFAQVLSSVDGFNWTHLVDLTGSAPGGIRNLVYWKNYYWLVRSAHGISRSSDCITWNHYGGGHVANIFRLYVAGERLLAESASTSRMMFLESPDVTWQLGGEKPVLNSFHDAVWANNLLSLAAERGTSIRYGEVYTTADGTSFTLESSAYTNLANGGFWCIAYGNNRYVAVGLNGQTCVKIDGGTWELRTDVFPFSTQQTIIKFIDGKFWLLRNDNSAGPSTTGRFFSSVDASNGSWTESTLGFVGAWTFEGGAAMGLSAISGDMNPAHIIRECLTDPDWGLGYSDSDIDNTSFTIAADKLYSENFGLSFLWNRQSTIEDFINEVKKHIDAALFVDRQTGKFKLVLIRDDYDVGSLITLDRSNIQSVSDFSRSTFGELTNSITVQFWDKELKDDSSITVQDIALAQMQGATINTTQQYNGITNKTLAARVAQRDLKTLSTPLVTCIIYATREAAQLNIGSPFKFTWPDFKCDELVMRVTAISYGDGAKNRVRITCTQDIYRLPSAAIIVPETPVWVDPNTDPVPVENQMLFEVPYLEAVQRQGQSAVDAVILADNTASFVGAAAAKPSSNSVNAGMYVNAGSGFEFKATLDFCATCVLDDDISYMTTAFNVIDIEDIELAPDGSWLQIDEEIMIKVSLVGNNLIVKRGALDTVPAPHAADSIIYFWDSLSGIDSTQYIAGESVDVKLTPKTGKGDLALDEAATDTLIFVGRLARPYPPGNVKIDDEYYPALANGVISVTWAHRDKTQQTGETYLDFTSTNIGPEEGTVYNLRLLKASDESILDQKIGIADNAATLLGSFAGPVIVELESEKDGLVSYQKYSIPLDYNGSSGLLTEDEETLLTEDNEILDLENSVPTGLDHEAEFVFSGTFAATDKFTAIVEYIASKVYINVNGAGKSSFDEMATDLANQLNIAIGDSSWFTGTFNAVAVGPKVTLYSSVAYMSVEASASFVSASVVTQQYGFPITTGTNETSYVDLFSGGQALLSNLSPTHIEAFNNTGTAIMTLWVTGLTYALKKAIGGSGSNWGRKAYPINWTVTIPSNYYLDQLIGQVDTLPASINAIPDFATYGISAVTAAANLSQTRSAVKITCTNNYAMAIVNAPTVDYDHPSDYQPFVKINEAGTASFPSGAKQLTTIALWLSPGTSIEAGQRYIVTLNGVDYEYTATGSESSIEDISNGLAAIIPSGSYSVNWYSTLQLIEIERNVINTPFDCEFTAGLGSVLTATIIS